MVSVKVLFRPSSIKGKEGRLYYRIIHAHGVKMIKTCYKLYESEWDKETATIKTVSISSRIPIVEAIRSDIHFDLQKIYRVIEILQNRKSTFTVADIATSFLQNKFDVSLTSFMSKIISALKVSDEIRTSETYTTALCSFMRFRGGVETDIALIDGDMMKAYEGYLKRRGLTLNTISFYMRILRAVYNRAVEQGFVQQSYPFRHVYTGIEKTRKRALPIEMISSIKNMVLPKGSMEAFARDIFMFSFYTRGMSFVDMAFLKCCNLKNGMLTYHRKKTGQKLSIRWESCMQQIVDAYPSYNSIYLLPIIRKTGSDERKQYKSMIYAINGNLKKIGSKLGLFIPLTLYVARHSWASAARRKNIPISIISEGMGHDSEATTQIYLNSLDTQVVDDANRLILNSL